MSLTHLFRLIFGTATLVTASPLVASDPAAGFFRPALDAGKDLPAALVFPKGRIFPYGGFSPIPTREKENGFTILGPTYANYENGEPNEDFLAAYVGDGEAAGLPVIYPVGVDLNFDRDNGSRPRLEMSQEELVEKIRAQVLKVASNPAVAWWNIDPEELLYYRQPEMEYLRTVCDTIRENDPLKRPIYMYDANNRSAVSFRHLMPMINVLGKGMYVNYSGKAKERVWCRWSAEEQVLAKEEAGDPEVISIAVPEMFEEPPAEDLVHIPAWVRHDVYSALVSGAQGVIIFSLWPRENFPSFEKYYAAYAQVGQELTKPNGLGEILLFGERRNDLKLAVASGPETLTMIYPDAEVHEPVTYSSVNTREIAFGTARYYFVVNDSGEAVSTRISGFPAPQSEVRDVLAEKILEASPDGILSVDLPPWGVRVLQFKEKQS